MRVERGDVWRSLELRVMTIRKFEELIAWQKARKLTSDIYSVSGIGNFAKDFSLNSKLKRLTSQ